MGSERGELTRALTQRAIEAKNGSRSLPDDLVTRAVAIAHARTSDQRAWALTRLAAALRRAEHHDEALWVLDVADGLRPSMKPECAVFTSAIGVHCDRGDLGVARMIGEEQLGRSLDLKLLRAMVRVYHGIFVQSEDPKDEARWRDMSRRVESLEALEVGV